jgi:hypothetical protein
MQIPCNNKGIKCKVEDCNTKHFYCSCEQKIPIEDREYLIDQRNKDGTRGRFQIGSRDKNAKPIRQQFSRVGTSEESENVEEEVAETLESTVNSSSSENLNTSGSSVDSSKLEGGRGYYNLAKYPRFVLEAVRYEVADEAAAALANALLLDLGILTADNSPITIDPKKIQREKARVCSDVSKIAEQTHQSVHCIGVDSKRDKGSLVFEEFEEEGKKCLRRTTATVDHLTFTVESGGYY